MQEHVIGSLPNGRDIKIKLEPNLILVDPLTKRKMKMNPVTSPKVKSMTKEPRSNPEIEVEMVEQGQAGEDLDQVMPKSPSKKKTLLNYKRHKRLGQTT